MFRPGTARMRDAGGRTRDEEGRAHHGRDETAQLFSKGGALHPTAGAPRSRHGTPRCTTASLGVGRGTALASRCTCASPWSSCLCCCSRPTHRRAEFTPTNGRPRPWSQVHPSSKLWVLRSPRGAHALPLALPLRPRARTPPRFRHWSRSCGFARHHRPAVALERSLAYEGLPFDHHPVREQSWGAHPR
jgi:hypothetical protein